MIRAKKKRKVLNGCQYGLTSSLLLISWLRLAIVGLALKWLGCHGETCRTPQDPDDLVVGGRDEKQRQGVEQGEFDRLVNQVRMSIPRGNALSEIDRLDADFRT